MLNFLITILNENGGSIMVGVYLSSTCSPNDVKDTLFTKEKIEEISNRIANNVTDEIFKQLKKNIPSLKKELKENIQNK